ARVCRWLSSRRGPPAQQDLLRGIVCEGVLVVIPETPHNLQPVESAKGHQFLREETTHVDFLGPHPHSVAEIEQGEIENLLRRTVTTDRLNLYLVSIGVVNCF